MTTQQITEMHTAFADFRKAHEEALTEFKKHGTTLGETEAKVNKLSDKITSIEEGIQAAEAKAEAAKRYSAMQEAINQLESKVGRMTAAASSGNAEDTAKAAKSFFFKMLRTGQAHDSILRDMEAGKFGPVPDSIKTLHTGNDTAGGILAPHEYILEILADQVEYSPVRALAQTRQSSRSALIIPKRTGTASASWVAETGTRSETTNPTFGGVEVKSHELYAMTKVSRIELEDSVFNVEAFLRNEFAEQFGVAEGTAFISGNAVGKPEGLLTNSLITAVNGGHASAITGDAFINVFFSLKEVYINSATWLLNRTTLRDARKLKDGQGNYIWAAGIKTDARPATILDRPYSVCVDMPDIAADAYPVILGDIRRGYLVFDRIGMEVMLDPYTSKSSGLIEISARKRVGGQVILAEAIRKMKIAA